jgi:outer membrane protein assembly factor BamB
VVGHDSGLDAFDAADGGGLWSVSMGDDSYVYPTIVEGTVYTGSARGFHAFSVEEGRERWSATPDSLPMTTLDDLSTARAPVVVHGRLFASTANYVLSLDASGAIHWWADAAFSSLLEAPLATDGSDVFLTRGGQIGSLDLPIDPWQGLLDTDRRVPKKTGRRWHPYVEAYRGPVIGDGVVYQPRHSDDETSVVVLDVETGERRWGVQTAGDAAAIALKQDTLFVRDWGGWLYGVDATTGEKQWTREVDPDADASTGQPIAGADGVVVPTANRGVLAFSPSGDERWRLPDVIAQRIALVDSRLYLVLYTGDEDSAVRDDDYELRCYA